MCPTDPTHSAPLGSVESPDSELSELMCPPLLQSRLDLILPRLHLLKGTHIVLLGFDVLCREDISITFRKFEQLFFKNSNEFTFESYLGLQAVCLILHTPCYPR